MSVLCEHRRSAKPDDATAANEDSAHIDPPTDVNCSVSAAGNNGRVSHLTVAPQRASVQLSENASADVEKGRPSRSRFQDCPLASTPLRTRRVPSAGINTAQTP